MPDNVSIKLIILQTGLARSKAGVWDLSPKFSVSSFQFSVPGRRKRYDLARLPWPAGLTQRRKGAKAQRKNEWMENYFSFFTPIYPDLVEISRYWSKATDRPRF